MMMFPEGHFGASSSEASALGGNDAGPSNAGPSNVAPADSPLSWRSFPSVPADLSPLPSDASIPSLPSLPGEASGTGQEGAAAPDIESESGEPPAKRPRKGPMPAEGAGPSNEGLAQASGQPREGTSGGEERDGPPNTPGEIRSKLADFLSAYGQRRATQSFVERTATELGLEEASPDKLLFIEEEIERKRRDIDPTHPTSSGQNAAAMLILAVEAWEKSGT